MHNDICNTYRNHYMTERGNIMFCTNCGANIPEGAKFCGNCGTKILDIPSTSTVEFNKVRFDQIGGVTHTPKQQPVSVSGTKLIGTVHWEITKLSSKLSQDFVEDLTRKNFEWFIKSAEGLAEAAFQKVDSYFLKVFQSNGFLQFQAPQIQSHTRPHTGRWLSVYNSALQIYQSIDDEAQTMREYRELRKDSRGQIVGGGFGLAGAIKGMVTAGAINLATGTLHSLVNSMGNAVDNLDANTKRQEFFKTQDYVSSLKNAFQADCYAMIEGFSTLWNSVSNEKFRFYSNESKEQAYNILDSISNYQTTQVDVAFHLEQIISLYPVSPELYLIASNYAPELKEQLFLNAKKYGFSEETVLSVNTIETDMSLEDYAERTIATVFSKYSFTRATANIFNGGSPLPSSEFTNGARRAFEISDTDKMYFVASENTKELLVKNAVGLAITSTGIYYTDKENNKGKLFWEDFLNVKITNKFKAIDLGIYEYIYLGEHTFWLLEARKTYDMLSDLQKDLKILYDYKASNDNSDAHMDVFDGKVKQVIKHSFAEYSLYANAYPEFTYNNGDAILPSSNVNMARTAFGIPHEEKIYLLANGNIFGRNAFKQNSKGLAVTTSGIYYRDENKNVGRLLWNEFVHKVLEKRYGTMLCIDDLSFNILGGGDIPLNMLIDLQNNLKRLLAN